ncbi:AMP-binding protein [Streptomyces sp. STR69]|uniref:AMP-binding protein n=1 Tax=Streptomyces sp. STR69 TaxID=1796942 RepID=UPI0021C7C4C7|nr:AMP-binding protein [Streptomyces sp. STR69]
MTTISHPIDPSTVLSPEAPHTVLELFERQAWSTPQAVALAGPGEESGYGELLGQVRRGAAGLRALGLCPGEVVAVDGAHTVAAVTGTLAALWAGAVVLPLDPSLPPARRSALLTESEAALLLRTDAAGADAGTFPGRVVGYGELMEAGDRAQVPVPAPPGPDAGACLIPGSGASPRPGAVPARHDVLAHRVAWVARTLPCGPGDRVAHLAGSTADALVRQVLPALAGGGTVCLPPAGRPPDDLAAALGRLAASRATVLHTTPAALDVLLGVCGRNAAPDLSAIRLLCLSGEPLAGTLVRRWRRAFPASSAQFVNLYGTAESALVAAWWPVPREADEGIVPVGHGIDGTQLLVVNRRGRLSGIGELGEILVRSPYLRREPGPAALLETNPFRPGDADDLVQRTGDLGRYLPDGSVQIVGRLEDQLRIQGVRVHPAEVGAVLGQHPAVASAAVVARRRDDGDGDGGGQQLVAYVVPAADSVVDPGLLRQAVAERLSAAAVPAHVVPLDALPLTPHGRLDRSALPAAGQRPATAPQETGPPRGGTEEAIAAYWAEVLGVPAPDRTADFFALGGHSLLMARVLARVRRDFGTALDLRDLFEAPTVAALAARIDACGPAPAQTVPAPPADAGEPGGQVPLTAEQEGVWFLEQLAPEAGAYNMAGVLALPGDVAAEQVHGALDRLVERHEALRTAFVVERDRPVQRVLPPGPADFGVLAPATGRDEALARLTAEGARPFVLTGGRPLRARLIRCVPDAAEQFLGLTIHHLSCDGWSWDIVLRELDELICAAREERKPVLAAPRLQYADHAVRSRRPGQEARRAAAVAYWRRHLGAPPPVLDLPTSRPRPPVQTHRGSLRPVPVPDGLAARLTEYCRSRGVTPYMVLLAAFGLVLARTADQDEVVLGTDSAGRDRAEAEETVGFFVRTHALRLDLGGGPSFDDAVGRVRELLLASHPHQHLSFSRLVEAVRPVRDPSRTPVFQVMLRMPPSGSPRARRVLRQLSDGELPADAALAPAAKFDLTLVARAEPDRLRLDVEYNADLFDTVLVDAMGRRLVGLLHAALRAPDRPEAVQEAGRPAHPFGAALPGRPQPRVMAEFARQAAAAPDAPALRCADGHIGYGDLAARVAATARRLRPGDVTAIVGGKHPDSITALLAAVQAGAVAVPVDEELPAARQRELAELAGATVVLAAGRDAGPSWCEDAALPVLTVAPAPTAVFGAVPDAPPPGVSPDPAAPAHVFFTSGSTGTPKAVLGRHHGLDHFAAWERAEFAVRPGDRVAQLTTYSFDAVLRDVFVPLSAGAALCLPPAAAREDALRLLEWLAAEQVSVVHTTPSVVASWLTLGADAAGPDLSALRLICLAGEPLTGELVARLRAGLPSCRAEIVNFYGPTETTMIKTFLRVPEPPGEGTQPVGGPLPETQVAVLGRDGRPCLPYERGEVVIRTPYRAEYLSGGDRGFRPNPFHRGAAPDDLLFWTGDTAVLRPDGGILLTGRRDAMVKLRGIRVDPAEVSAAVATHPQVADCHVEAHRDAGQVSLVAYVVRVRDAQVSTETLRAHVAERLPAAMLPSLILFLDALPLLPNGKPDRNALLGGRRDGPEAGTAAGPVEPRTPEEARLLPLWRSVLGNDGVGVTDDFFAVGGHSLLATVLITRIRKEFGAAVSLRHLLAAPRVDRLAPALAGLGAGRADGPGGPDGAPEHQGPLLLLREGRPEAAPLFLVHPMGGDIVCYQPLVRALPAGPRPVHAFRAPGLDGGPVPRDLRELAARYLHELRRLQPSGPYRLGGWSFGGAVAVEMARQLSFDGERTELLVLLDSYAPGSAAYGDAGTSARDDLRAFAEDVGRLTGADREGIEADLLRPPRADDPEPAAELRRRFALFGAHRGCAARHRAATIRLPETRLLLFVAGAQRRPEGTTPSLGWSELLGRAVEPVVVADTDHYSVVADAGVAALLGRALEDPAGPAGH